MRRPWILRFAWLLWLASLGTAVLPLAHDLSHRHGLPVLVGSATLAASADAGSAGQHAPSEAELGICVVCAHLGSQHLDLPESAPRLPALRLDQALRPSSAPAAFSTPVAWLRPAPRAPPTSLSL